ncbi:MAG TPA: LCP family protein [bacterium]|nr:LCP family protein [bacterium]
MSTQEPSSRQRSSDSPSRAARPGRSRGRPRWARVASAALRGIVIGFAAVLAAGIVVAALHAEPAGPTFGWPFRVVGRTNLLVMGLDRTVSDQNPKIVYSISRTDTLIAVSFDPDGRQIHVLSIPRDTRAAIPGRGTDKINAAYAYAKEALARRTVENLTGVALPYYITIRERGYVHLIDAVGGVTVRIDKDLNYDDNWDGLHIHLKKGNRRLGGKAAIEYARFRHDALGDIGRITRQQQVIDALIAELRRPQVVFHAGRILRVFREDIDTNLRPEQLIALGWFGARVSQGALDRETLPGRFGASDWLPNPAEDRALVARMFYGMNAADLAPATVEVVTSGASPSAVGDALARLAALGVRVVRVAPAPDAVESVVIMHSGDPRVAAVIAAATRTGRIASDTATPGAVGAGGTASLPSPAGTTSAVPASGAAQFTLVLGHDYDRLVVPPLIQ